MCGINGGFFPNYSNINNILSVMNNTLKHRGPDEHGYFIKDNFGISMQRLSIIDITSGHQPIFNHNKTLAIIFNGEIYNYKELKNDLIPYYHFETNSDTEVILLGYQREGTNFFKKLRGMYAFCIFDLVNELLICARDSMGEKPFYYYKNNDLFLFSSELKSLLSSDLIPKEIDRTSLEYYFQLGYIPSPRSIVSNVFKLPPGHYLVFNKFNHSLILEKFIDSNSTIKFSTFKNSVSITRNLLEDSIKKTLISDVPVGVFLSGGIDSSIVSIIASKNYKEQLHSFHLKVPHKDFDESSKSKQVSKLVSSNHHEVELTDSLLLSTIEKVGKLIDEPLGDESFIPTYIISNEASKHVKVVLTGDGADEIFGGYNKYLVTYFGDILKKIPKFIINFLRLLTKILSKESDLYQKTIKILDNYIMDEFDRVFNLMTLGFKETQLDKILTFKPFHTLKPLLKDTYYSQDCDSINKTLRLDQKIVLEGCMFPKVDRASMLNSIETRSPMVDYDLTKYINSLTSNYKIKSKNRKIILKEAFKDVLPKEILKQSKKGFSIPLSKLFKGKLSDDLLTLINNTPQLSPFININYVKELIISHKQNEFNNSKLLYLVYVFSYWYKNNILPA
jgi:asparagine synthase (glutamine-hydrolysing)